MSDEAATPDERAGERENRLTHATWVEALRDGELLGQRCPDCGTETAAPKAACHHCGSRSLETVSLPTEGVVYTETTVAVAPRDFAEETPYRVAIVDLGGARVLARLAEDCTADVGERVELSGTVGDLDDEVAPVFA